MAKPIGTVGNIPTLEVAGRVFTDLDNLIILYGSTTNTNGASLRRANGTSGYTPSGSNSFKILALRQTATLGSTPTNGYGSLGYSDNDVAVNTATAATNPVYVAGALNNFPFSNPQTQAQVPSEHPLDFTVPNGKFVFADGGGGVGSVSWQVFGYEVAP